MQTLDFLSKNIKTKNYQLIISNISDLCNSVDFQSFRKKNEFKSEKRAQEKFATKTLLNFFNPNLELSYNKHGAPQLNNQQHISISHSKTHIAIIIGEKKVSVDLEIISKKAESVVNKFLNNRELKLILNHETATLFWSAKESLFKLHQRGMVNFKKDIEIIKLYPKSIKCRLFDKVVLLTYEKIEDHFVVYSFD